MPTLHYKYRMNEPFVNGERGQYQVSHEQVEFKKRFVYGMDAEGRLVSDQKVKTTQDEIDDFKEEHNLGLINEFEGRRAPDISTLIVKQDQADMFGLKIVTRNCPQVYRLFEFDIDEYISFSQMR